MRAVALTLAAGLCSGVALAENILVTPADNGKTIALTVGQCIDVRLSSQTASTGYAWYLAPGLNEAMSFGGRTETTVAGAPPGTPSQLDYLLCAAAPGEVEVKFLNYRPWEKDKPPGETLAFAVKIAK